MEQIIINTLGGALVMVIGGVLVFLVNDLKEHKKDPCHLDPRLFDQFQKTIDKQFEGLIGMIQILDAKVERLDDKIERL